MVRRFSGVMLLIFTLALVACSPAPVAPAPTATLEPTTPVAEAPTSEPAGIQITDARGQEITLAAPGQRIVSLAPSITEILFAVGAGSQVVANTQYCNYPPEADALPEIGGFSAKTISIESIVALDPDLVIGGSTAQTTVAEALAPMGIPTLIFEPKSFEDVYANIAMVGLATGHSAEAEALVAEMQARVAAVEAVVAEIPAEQRPSIFYEVFDEPLLSAGPNTFIGQMMTLVGATNIFADTNEEYPVVSAEAIVDRNPDVIVGPDSHGDKLTPEQLALRPGWERINAVQNERIYLLDGDMASRAGPRLVDVLESLAKILYPENF